MPSCNVTDTYDYDAFGNLIYSTGTTPNVYLYSGEQFDPDLHLYYNRARYLNTSTGRFWSKDDAEGHDERSTSLHKYVYAEGNPVDNLDPTGNEIDEVVGSFAVATTINAMLTLNAAVSECAAKNQRFRQQDRREVNRCHELGPRCRMVCNKSAQPDSLGSQKMSFCVRA